MKRAALVAAVVLATTACVQKVDPLVVQRHVEGCAAFGGVKEMHTDGVYLMTACRERVLRTQVKLRSRMYADEP